jgi:hypothetical protein
MRGISRKGTVKDGRSSPLFSKWVKLGKGKGGGNTKRLFATNHKLNMELDLQSLFGLNVHSSTHWLRPRNPPPRIWAHMRERYWSAKIDDISL